LRKLTEACGASDISHQLVTIHQASVSQLVSAGHSSVSVGIQWNVSVLTAVLMQRIVVDLAIMVGIVVLLAAVGYIRDLRRYRKARKTASEKESQSDRL
jgi:hypothetical protein